MSIYVISDWITYEQNRYKVHPGVEVTEKLLEVLQPETTVFTHGPIERAEALEGELSSQPSRFLFKKSRRVRKLGLSGEYL
ncbi:hypothetical protein [Salipaludibacillus keqinensis]|uniref:hypothetical protein n=1 Tax=Salipaludibacillus keqinensis TaxID=2045207 RepID=UPI0011AFAEB6|nr:hypothetical protein [Salipaludibacillus keqinensis]